MYLSLVDPRPEVRAQTPFPSPVSAERLVELMGWYRIMFLEGALQEAMLDVTAAIDAVVDTPHLPAVLRAVLALGNALGYGAGTRATSFSLSSLRVLRCDSSAPLPSASTCRVLSLSLFSLSHIQISARCALGSCAGARITGFC